MNLSISHHSNRVYVALAATFLPEDLHRHASAAGLCYFRLIQDGNTDEPCLIRVTSLPYRLDSAAERVFTLWVEHDQLAQALPWDRAMQGQPTCEVREHLESHLLALPLSCQSVEPTEEPALQNEQDESEEEDLTLIPLPTVFVSCETMERIAHEEQEQLRKEQERRAQTHDPLSGKKVANVCADLWDAMPKGKYVAWARLIWFRTALAVLKHQLIELTGSLLRAFTRLNEVIQAAYAAQRDTRQPLIHASPVYIGRRQVGWHLTIGVPVSACAAA